MNFKDFLKGGYQKIIHIHDSPHKISGGFAIGVFLGILPGAGPVAALVLAYVFRVNRAAALAGSLLTNSWFSIITFILAVKIGALLIGLSWQDIYQECKDFLDHFQFSSMLDGSTWVILKPLLVGYTVIGTLCGVAVYLCMMIVITQYRRRKNKTTPQDHSLRN